MGLLTSRASVLATRPFALFSRMNFFGMPRTDVLTNFVHMRLLWLGKKHKEHFSDFMMTYPTLNLVYSPNDGPKFYFNSNGLPLAGPLH